MKYCTWCGKPGPENAEICPIDGHPLQTATPPPVPLAHRLRGRLPTKLATLVVFLLGAAVFLVGLGLLAFRIVSFRVFIIGIAMMVAAVVMEGRPPETEAGTRASDSPAPSPSEREMKCTWCGKRYPAGNTVCAQDQQPLEPV